jgi:hypothetical protein
VMAVVGADVTLQGVKTESARAEGSLGASLYLFFPGDQPMGDSPRAR